MEKKECNRNIEQRRLTKNYNIKKIDQKAHITRGEDSLLPSWWVGTQTFPNLPRRNYGRNALVFRPVFLLTLDRFKVFFAFTDARFFVISILANILRDAFFDAFSLETLQRNLNVLFVSNFDCDQLYHNLYFKMLA